MICSMLQALSKRKRVLRIEREIVEAVAVDVDDGREEGLSFG